MDSWKSLKWIALIMNDLEVTLGLKSIDKKNEINKKYRNKF